VNNIRSKFRYRSNILALGLILIGLMVIFTFGTGNVSAAGNTVYVNASGGSDSYNGLSPVHTTGKTGPKATITSGVAAVTANGTLYIANGVYSGTKNVATNKNMNIKGQSKTGTIINGDNINWIFFMVGQKIVISDLTICEGNTNGAAIENNGNLTVNNCLFQNNNATYGGAIKNDINCVLTLNGCTFKDNTATHGGVIYNRGSMTVINSNFFSNSASTDGGAVYNEGKLTVETSKFSNNAANGGSIYNNGNVTVINSTLNGNFANIHGGAIYNVGTFNVVNSSLSGNVANNNGGAIYNEGKLKVTSSILSANNAGTNGGAIFTTGTSYTSDVHFNSIVGNTAVTGNAIYNEGTLDVSNNWWGSNNGPVHGDVFGKTVLSWLVLKLSAVPVSIGNNDHSTVTADLRYNNYGLILLGSSANGMTVKFTTTLGTISQASVVNGTSKSILKSGTKTGTAIISAYLDNQTVQTLVKVKDTISPKINSTNPKNSALGIPKTAVITVKFSEKISAGTNINNIKVKNINTGKYVNISKLISGNIFTIKTATKNKNTWYQVIIPKAAVKDLAGNNLQTSYSFKFKTSR